MAGRHANRTLSLGHIATLGMASVIPALSLSCSLGAAREDNPQFPAFVYRSEASLQAYQFAAAMPELLAQVPCFCGCGQDPAYTSLRGGSCRFLDLCNGNFRARALFATGDFWGENPACYLTDAEIGDGARS